MIIIKIPKTCYEDIKVQSCPFCGSDLIQCEWEDGEYSINNADENYEVIGIATIKCQFCGLKAPLKIWNNIAKIEKKEE